MDIVTDLKEEYLPALRKFIEKQFHKKSYSEFKKSLAEIVVNYLEPFRRKQKELLTREVYVQEILKQGQARALTIAQSTMAEVKERMGLS